MVDKMEQHERPIGFNPGFKFPGGNRSITFDAASFTAWVEDALPAVKTMTPCEHRQATERGIKVGNYYFYLRPLPMYEMRANWMFSTKLHKRRCGLPIYRRMTKAYVYFSDVVNIPVLCNAKLEPWMSLTPNEVLTQRNTIRRAKGNVGMAGLGMGWAAKQMLQKKTVKHLTIYERDQAVIDVFGKPLQEQYTDRVTLLCGDAYEADWGQHDIALWDIWPGYGDADFDPEFKAIKKKLEAVGTPCIGWGDNVYDKRY